MEAGQSGGRGQSVPVPVGVGSDSGTGGVITHGKST